MFATPGIEPATFKKRDKSLKRCATVIRNSCLWYISMIVSAILSSRPPIGGEPARTSVGSFLRVPRLRCPTRTPVISAP